MNEITLTKKEQLLRDGYKLIYPNNLGLSISMHSKKEKYKTIYKKVLTLKP